MEVMTRDNSVVIYRINKSPERKIFHIDVGDTPKNLIKHYLQKIMRMLNERT